MHAREITDKMALLANASEGIGVLQSGSMLQVLGHPKKLCNGITRRDLLTAGAALGLTLPAFLRSQAEPCSNAPDDKHFGRAKSCILLFLYGSPSQLELADQKPDAPVEVRGELGSIKSTLPGCDVCELLAAHQSRDAQRHRRAVGHAQAPDPRRRLRDHCRARHRRGDGAVPARRAALAVHRLDGRVPRTAQEPRDRPARPVPDNIALPFPFSSQRTGEVHRAGPYPAFLGNQFNPHFTALPRQGDREDHQDAAPNTPGVRRTVRRASRRMRTSRSAARRRPTSRSTA